MMPMSLSEETRLLFSIWTPAEFHMTHDPPSLPVFPVFADGCVSTNRMAKPQIYMFHPLYIIILFESCLIIFLLKFHTIYLALKCVWYSVSEVSNQTTVRHDTKLTRTV